MSLTALVPALALAGQLVGDPGADREMISPVQCPQGDLAERVHVDHIADVRLAVPGSYWWVPTIDEEGQQRFFSEDPLVLTERQSQTTRNVAPGEYRATVAAVALPVPESASPGQTWDLTVDGGPPLAELRVGVGQPEAVTGSVQGFAVRAGGAQPCDVSCADEGLTVPSTPQLVFSRSGGPFVLDAFAGSEGDPFEGIWLHRADSYWLEEVSEPTEIVVDLDALGFTGPLDVHVEVRDPVTLELVHEDLLAVAPLDPVPADTAGLPECDFGGGTVTGCPAFGGLALALLFAPALGVRLRRFKRRSSSRS